MPARDTLPKRYIETDMGQIHIRDLGDPDSTHAIVLIHWTPLSGRMWSDVAPLIAEDGWRVVMPDLLGYGRSDPRPDDWTMGDWAENLAQVMEVLGLKRVCVLGGHNGSSVAAEMAIRYPQGVSHVVLDGCPILTPELREAFKALTSAPRPVPKDDGSHMALAWQRTEGLLREYIPGFTVTPDTIEMIWPAMIDFLETDFVSSGPVAGPYALDERLPLITQPVLLLGAEKDTLAKSFPTAKAILPHAASHFFPGQHPIHFPDRAEEFVDVVIDFVKPVQ
jgi:haloalkane dehalogenase